MHKSRLSLRLLQVGDTDHLWEKVDLYITMAAPHNTNKRHINALQGNYANVCKLLSGVITEEQNEGLESESIKNRKGAQLVSM